MKAFDWLNKLVTPRRPSVLSFCLPVVGIMAMSAVIAGGAWIWSGAIFTGFLSSFYTATVGVSAVSFLNFFFSREIRARLLKFKVISPHETFNSYYDINLASLVDHLRGELNKYHQEKNPNGFVPLPKVRLGTFEKVEPQIIVSGRNINCSAIYMSTGLLKQLKVGNGKFNPYHLQALIMLNLQTIYAQRGFTGWLGKLGIELFNTVNDLTEYARPFSILVSPLTTFLSFLNSKLQQAYIYDAAKVVADCNRGTHLWQANDLMKRPSLIRNSNVAQQGAQAQQERIPYTGMFSFIVEPVLAACHNVRNNIRKLAIVGDDIEGVSTIGILIDWLVRESIGFVQESFSLSPTRTRIEKFIKEYQKNANPSNYLTKGDPLYYEKADLNPKIIEKNLHNAKARKFQMAEQINEKLAVVAESLQTNQKQVEDLKTLINQDQQQPALTELHSLRERMSNLQDAARVILNLGAASNSPRV